MVRDNYEILQLKLNAWIPGLAPSDLRPHKPPGLLYAGV